MIFMPSSESKGQKMVLPSGLWLGKDFRTKVRNKGSDRRVAVAEAASALQRNSERRERAGGHNRKHHARHTTPIRMRWQLIDKIRARRIYISRWRHRCSRRQHAG